ncbi:sensor histidine kinase [[Clostridium] hylemonae]|uniref:histidine kinase n=1 Tax=[Clostridium] hylemonae DSM 15053 TaxID=553973 RepID=C0C2U9_9FIRM|nr:HAMP domain-containing sensor histidine kinase [[Clostridium] hylemonae]EEG73460.1 ATPase/histidine kinase/DNA gyrase B/HSP90 domain protein [[Clostridium] hylemonae DSM 15053]QEK19602.1 Alkaline phosphatase synthesis sensor protein PhoR [[Clostridium] hylemonae DSM 15053]
MTEKWMVVLSIGIAVVSVLASAGTVIYYICSIKKMEKVLDNFQKDKTQNLTITKETRESKLVSRLNRLLGNVSRNQEQALEERDQVASLVSDLSHQLKTPLSNILMYTELLGEEGLSPQEKQEFLRETRMQTEKMQWLMKTLMKASRLEQGIISFPVNCTGIRKTVAMAVGGIYARASEKKITIETSGLKEYVLYHNSKWTAEALENILENAVKYSPEGSVITIGLYPMEFYARVDIQDQGLGIEEKEYNDIFKRFYRGKQVEQQEGSGLGLYLAQLILNREKGYITVTSSPGRGSCFHVYLLNEISAKKTIMRQ